MAFSLYASVGATTTQLNDGNPFRLESAEGMSGGAIVRHEQSGPLQSGATDLGYRLAPRILTLNLLFRATTDSQLDTYRQTLMDTFKPLSDVSIFLTAERDDGTRRILVCHTVDDIVINLVPEHRAAHMHRATIRLRAANPLWRANDITSGTASFASMSQWWLAGGAIGTAQVKDHAENIIGPTFWNAFGSITGFWAIAFITNNFAGTMPVNAYVWRDLGSARLFREAGSTTFTVNNLTGRSWPFAGTVTGLHIIRGGGNTLWQYWNGTALATNVNTGGDIDLTSQGAWSSGASGTANTGWSPTIHKAMLWTSTNSTQQATEASALVPYMLNMPPGSVTVVNDGDVYAYPVMRLQGPMSDPVIVNQTIGGTLDLTGITLGTADLLTIDLRSGDKRIFLQDGTNRMGSATTAPIGAAQFAIAPVGVAAGGTNVITMTPGSVGSAAVFTVEFTKRYLSF